jgi:hypothetical protein
MIIGQGKEPHVLTKLLSDSLLRHVSVKSVCTLHFTEKKTHVRSALCRTSILLVFRRHIVNITKQVKLVTRLTCTREVAGSNL